jgi:hypothetical protein
VPTRILATIFEKTRMDCSLFPITGFQGAGLARQTQTNPTGLRHLLSIVYAENERNKANEVIPHIISCLQRFLVAIFENLAELRPSPSQEGRRRQELLELLDRIQPQIELLDRAVEAEARQRPDGAGGWGRQNCQPFRYLSVLSVSGPPGGTEVYHR